MTKGDLSKINSRIQKIKSALSKIGDMRPGSLTEQFKDPKKKTGAYYQLSYTLNMRSKTEYIRKEHLRKIRQQIASYKKFKNLNEELITLNIERSKLEMKADKGRL